MQHLKRVLAIWIFLASVIAVGSDSSGNPKCVPIQHASQYVGKTVCVVGKVYHVSQTRSGTAIINFCADYKKCPFSVVVFERDLDKVGNLNMFEGRILEVTGRVREYKDSPEMVVKSRDQFSGEAVSPQIRR